MDKKTEIIDIIKKLSEIPEKKKSAISNQSYEMASKLRDEERTLLQQLDDVSGVIDFYNKVYNTEKVLQHLDLIINSTEQLNKLRPNFNEVFEDISFDKYLIQLHKQRDEAYEAVIELRKLIK
jgi:Asp-tRNA(Asn)/Glu-tRNA(Gln) amidotransferase C subunit